jgi:hypothetical protein
MLKTALCRLCRLELRSAIIFFLFLATAILRFAPFAALSRLATTGLIILFKVRNTVETIVLGFSLNMVLIFCLELIEYGIPFGFGLGSLLLDSVLLSLLIFDIFATAEIGVHVRSTHIESLSTFAFLGKEIITNMTNDILSLNFFKLLFDSFTQGKSFLFLADDFIYHVHVFGCAFLLGFLGHAQNFLVAFADMLNECSSISDQSTFNSVNEGASPLVKAVRTADLNLTVTG